MLKKIVACLGLSVAFAAHAAKPVAYTAQTAPDTVSRSVLLHAVARIDEGGPQNVHRNFPLIIERNFAKLDSSGARALIDNLSDLELSHLAQLYSTANFDGGRDAMLLDLLATRLDAARLAKITKYFGYAQVSAAIGRSAPEKYATYALQANASFTAPVPGAALRLPRRPSSMRLGLGSGATPQGIGEFLNYTPYEIYLSFRTMPVGALAPAGAAFETGVIIYGASYISYNAGYAVGHFA